MNSRVPIAILGAGPAGMGAAFQLARRSGFEVSILERNGTVGGNSGSFELEGMQVDFGSHRLHPSCHPEILSDIQQWLQSDLLPRPRHGRIRLNGKWLRFPLRPLDLLTNVSPAFSLGVARDSIVPRGTSAGPESFASILERSLGSTICREFYFPYAAKIWGLPPGELAAEQARRRVSANSLGKMVKKVLALTPGFRSKTAGLFYYPRAGFGAITEAYRHAAEASGASLMLETTLTELAHRDGRWHLQYANGAGTSTLAADLVLSTIPLTILARSIREPAAPKAVLDAAAALQYRAMILIYVVLETDRFTEFDAHYFPGADIPITRLSEPKNYSLSGPAGRTVLCAELPCSREDATWNASPAELGAIVTESLKASGLPVSVPVRHIEVRRLPQAYPIYTRDYFPHLETVDRWLSGLPNLVSFGRQGLFAHDNTHHALAMAYALNRCIGEDGKLDLHAWEACRQEFEKHVVED